jgi:glycosyltransferase involved in cell wall biosynthesis
VSVVITSFTVERFPDFIETLESLRNQTMRDFETLVVIDRSRELYEKLCHHIAKNGYRNTRIIFNEKPGGLSSARNLGITQASGEIIGFIDDDAIACPCWIEKMLEAYADDSIIGVTGPIYPLWEDNSMAWCPEEFYWLFACTSFDRGEAHEVRNGYGANMSFRHPGDDVKALFSDWLGSMGEKKKTTAEEAEMATRLTGATGKRIIYSPDMAVRHKVRRYRLSQRYVRERSYREGFSKMILRKYFDQNRYGGQRFLKTEYSLLRCILLPLIPADVVKLLRTPALSFKRLRLTATVLSCVATGYTRGFFYSTKKLGGTP